MPLDYSHFVSRLARERPKSAIRDLLPLEARPNMISMLAGKPNPLGFPFESISLKLRPDAELGTDPATGLPAELVIQGKELEDALQYGATPGFGPLRDALAAIVSKVHGRTINDGSPAGDFKLSVGVGSQDVLTKAFSAVLDEGDSLVAEAPLYTGALPWLQSLKTQIVGVDVDAEGLSASALEMTLANWGSDPRTKHLRFPKVVYTVPCGSNPAGTTASAERKRDVLAIARKYGLLIFEDDPYYYLNFDGLGEDPESRARVPSYFALEREGGEQHGYGYVMRFESLSKIMSAGLRLGFVVGPPPLVQAIDTTTATSNLHPSGPSQAIAAALLRHWGIRGFLHHVDRVAALYKKRRDEFERLLEHGLGHGEDGKQAPLATWVTPVAGMFFWLKLHLPPTSGAPQGDSFHLMMEQGQARGILVVPGAAFYPQPDARPYVRVSFSILPAEEVAEGFRRLRTVIQDAWCDAGYDSIPPIPQ